MPASAHPVSGSAKEFRGHKGFSFGPRGWMIIISDVTKLLHYIRSSPFSGEDSLSRQVSLPVITHRFVQFVVSLLTKSLMCYDVNYFRKISLEMIICNSTP